MLNTYSFVFASGLKSVSNYSIFIYEEEIWACFDT